MVEINSLNALSPLDGRYSENIKELSGYFSEFSLIKNRIRVEIEYLILLSKKGIIRKLKEDEENILRKIHLEFNLQGAEEVKAIEKITNHDMKAAEYYIKDKIKSTSLEDLKESIHIGLTTWDINHTCFALSIKESLESVFFKELEFVRNILVELTKKYKSLTMLARTHGQPAVPTTLGKEFAVFLNRLNKQIDQLKKRKISTKLNGAVGNYNAHVAAYPNIGWIAFSKEFIESFGLEPNFITTQIEPYDNFAEIFHNIIRINNIILNLDKDMWDYISRDYLKQKVKEGEVGSSTMPQKVNPINFENSEGNLGLANSLLDHLCNKLTVSRLQRDLSDSTVVRNIGIALGYSIVAYQSTCKGLNKIEVNEQRIKEDLNAHPEVITEAIQTILRSTGFEKSYESLKDFSRGKKLTLQDIHAFIDSLDIPPELKIRLKAITPENYIGLAEKLVDMGN